MGKAATFPRHSKTGDPTWEVASFYPQQGDWTEADYFDVTADRTGIEFVDGTLEFLPMPTRTHQEIIQIMWLLLHQHLYPKGGEAWVSGLRVRTRKTKIRMPDVVAMLDRNDKRAGEQVFEGADLVVEVISDDPKDRERDAVAKPPEYAAAGVKEYWIIDPQEQCITVHTLKSGAYAAHSVAVSGETAASALLKGFKVTAAELFQRD